MFKANVSPVSKRNRGYCNISFIKDKSVTDVTDSAEALSVIF